jgi:pimeloyl-ACP methyl ester carboxylesterase
MPSVMVNGVRIAYQEVGAGAPLLLIMGLGAPGALWEKHVEAYARHFRCILMDNRGAGESDKPQGPYTTSMMADDAAGLLDHLGIDSARVAGISMGSGIAQELALRHPAKVRSLLLISSWARCDTYMKEIFLHFQNVRPQLSPGMFTRLLQLWIFGPEYFHANFKELEEARQASTDEGAMPDHAFSAQCHACVNHDTLNRLKDIHQPCLLTVGETDIFTPVRCSLEIAFQLPAARLEIFKAAHCHHWEKLAEFNEMTTQFLLKN